MTTDELLGLQAAGTRKSPDSRLLRRMQKIDKMSITRKRQIVQVIDTFIEAEQLNAK